jgi:hypothetical protein
MEHFMHIHEYLDTHIWVHMNPSLQDARSYKTIDINLCVFILLLQNTKQ